jgi:Holliday junction resolvase RusA-like endonuclease
VSGDGRKHIASAEGMQALFCETREIFGEPASKANSRRLVRFGSMSRLIKSKKALTYAESFQQQCAPASHPTALDVSVEIHIWYASRRPDLDESLILDLLQGKIYLNDRQVKEKHIYWHQDKECPRCVITVTEMPGQKKDPGRKAHRGQGATQRHRREIAQATERKPV